jgi:ribosomal protein S12 methylthiotransferase accessory factor
VSIAELCASVIPSAILCKIADSLKYNGYPLFTSQKTPTTKSKTRIYPHDDTTTSTTTDDDTAAANVIEDGFVDDASIFPDVDISEVANEFDTIKNLVKAFADAGIPLRMKNVTQKDIGIPTFVASSIEWITRDNGYFFYGHGTHPDSRIALVRAITELSQTRAANIHGARDDLERIRYNENDEIHRRKWQFMPAVSSSKKKVIQFSKIQTHTNDDILDDIHVILDGLKRAGLKRAIVVDLTNRNVGIPVVRIIVPGLETFEVTNSIMGRRAKMYFTGLILNRAL